MFAGAANVNAEKVKQTGVKRVRAWLEDLLPDEERDEEDGGKAPPGKETSVIVNQLACKEVGCPDVEVVMTLLRPKPRPKLMFKIYKAAAELTNGEISEALQKALAAEQGTEHAHEHAEQVPEKKADEHGHDEHGHDEHVHSGDCCGHDHDDGHDGQHEHGHT